MTALLNAGVFPYVQGRHPVNPPFVPPSDGAPGATFATTHWSLVLQAGGRDAEQATTALGHLYQAYAQPLYSYLRRQGETPESARDLVQDVFLALLEKNQLAGVSPTKGRFRSYLLAAAHHRLVNEWNRQRRQKRGGGQIPLPLDDLLAEANYQCEPADPRSPEQAFEKRWALALLEAVLSRLRREWESVGKGPTFEVLRLYLSGDHQAPEYATVGTRLGLSEGAARVAVHRLRQRYRDVLRDEIAQTVAEPDDIDDELRHLLRVLRE